MVAVEQEQVTASFLNTLSEPWERQGFKSFVLEQSTKQPVSLHVVSMDGDAEEMRFIIKRIRTQLRFIIHSVRCWEGRHAQITHPLRKRYSAYEGALCYADLRRHWVYYRHAMREFRTFVDYL